MKKIFTVLLLICSFIYSSSQDNSIFRKTFYKNKNTAIFSYERESFLKQFVGDTIMFNFPDNELLAGFVVEKPDTVWLKKRPKKKPVLGKHYELNFTYKGIKKNGKYYTTPSSYINDKPFRVTSVNRLNGNQCFLNLLDIQNQDSIMALFIEVYPYDAYFTTTKAENLIDQIKGKTVYYTSSAPDRYRNPDPKFIKCKVLDGSYRVNISKSVKKDYYEIRTNSNITLQDEEGNVFNVSPLRSNQPSADPLILLQDEYDAQFKHYSIDSDIDLDILLEDDNYPFSFTSILGVTSKDCNIYQQIKTYDRAASAAKLYKGEVIMIGDVLKANNTDYYKACLNGKAFFIKANDVEFLDKDLLKLDTLAYQPQDFRDRFFKRQVALNKASYLKKTDEANAKINSYAKYGLVIPQWYVYHSRFFEGIDVTFYNPTDQDIKYITVSYQGYNAVDDPAGKTLTHRCTGPIKPGESAKYDLEFTWYTDAVKYPKFRSIVVEYRNGTTKRITQPDAIILPQELKYFFYKRDPVKDLK